MCSIFGGCISAPAAGQKKAGAIDSAMAQVPYPFLFPAKPFS
jgi:hypothetical protein